MHGDAAQLARERAYWDARALREAGLEPPDPLTAARARIAELERNRDEGMQMLQVRAERIADLEATLARVRELAIEWPKRPRPYGTGEFIRDECAYELEAALAGPGKLP